jgi:ketosteroid isomerase-like protein
MIYVNEDVAGAIVGAFHAAWSKGNVEGMLSWCHDDVTHYLNAGVPDGGPLSLFGKAELRSFFTRVAGICESETVPITFTFRDGIGKAQIESDMTHRKTRNTLSGTFRQFVIFKGFKIAALEDYHDAARMKAFCDMVRSEELQTYRANRRG